MCILDIRTKCTEAYIPDLEREVGILGGGQGRGRDEGRGREDKEGKRGDGKERGQGGGGNGGMGRGRGKSKGGYRQDCRRGEWEGQYRGRSEVNGEGLIRKEEDRGGWRSNKCQGRGFCYRWNYFHVELRENQ